MQSNGRKHDCECMTAPEKGTRTMLTVKYVLLSVFYCPRPLLCLSYTAQHNLPIYNSNVLSVSSFRRVSGDVVRRLYVCSRKNGSSVYSVSSCFDVVDSEWSCRCCCGTWKGLSWLFHSLAFYNSNRIIFQISNYFGIFGNPVSLSKGNGHFELDGNLCHSLFVSIDQSINQPQSIVVKALSARTSRAKVTPDLLACLRNHDDR